MLPVIITLISIPVLLVAGVLLIRFVAKTGAYLCDKLAGLIVRVAERSGQSLKSGIGFNLSSGSDLLLDFKEIIVNFINNIFSTESLKRRTKVSTDADFNQSEAVVEKKAGPSKKVKRNLVPMGIGAVVVLLVAFFFITRFFTTIPAGHVGVGTLFGKVQTSIYTEGIHIINPLVKITLFDARQKTHKESMGVPSSDQLITRFDLSIQYRLIKEQAPVMLEETGTPREVIEVHMMPLLRSQMREIGKSVPRAENFYEQAVQQRIQEELLSGLSSLAKKGIKIEKLLIREVTLPSIITDAVMRKKEAAQAAEKAKEELKKFKVDQERKEAQAEAEKRAELIQANKKKEVMLIGANAQLEAARIEAKAILVRAEAEAEAKRKIIDAITLEGYLKLESMNVLKELQEGNHLIILDPNTTSPLPFLNLDKIRK